MTSQLLRVKTLRASILILFGKLSGLKEKEKVRLSSLLLEMEESLNGQ